MKKPPETIDEALALVRRFIAQTTDAPPTDGEIARALSRYFVLNEIRGHVVLEREETRRTRKDGEGVP
ncbi:MAG: hypothetical protein JRI97_07335 [Deltaproteobacteria bacterium]|nr:hypothetical protein [Deltaproteobacteria bacterium]